MQWALENVVTLAELDNAAEVHHRYSIAEMAHHRQVMGDEKVGEPQIILQIAQQVDDLRLDRHVQGGDRLVGDDEPGAGS